MTVTVTMQAEAEFTFRSLTAGCAGFYLGRVIASARQDRSDDQTENESQNEAERFHGAIIHDRIDEASFS